LGSIADISQAKRDVRFTPDSGHLRFLRQPTDEAATLTSKCALRNLDAHILNGLHPESLYIQMAGIAAYIRNHVSRVRSSASPVLWSILATVCRNYRE
jgi:hypothetical protein